MAIDGFATHLPVLCHVLTTVEPRDILEVGCGWYSTPLFRVYARARRGEHYILETDAGFGQQVGDLYGCRVELFDGYTLPDSVMCQWGLVFIDHGIEAARAKVAMALKEWASIVVLHDSNPNWEPAYGYSQIIPNWKHHKQFTALYPHTLLLTDSDEIWQTLVA